MSPTLRLDRGAVLRHVVLGAAALIYAMPFIWMLLTSFKSRSNIFDGGLNPWPTQWAAIDNYAQVIFKVPMLLYLFNGVVVCAGILVSQILVAAPAAYALAKLRFPGARILLPVVLVSLAIPAFLPTLPLYLAFHWIGIVDSRAGIASTYTALILPFSISAFGIFLFRQHFKTVPDELVHAARIDGMSEWSIVWRVMVPQARAALIAFGIFSIVAHWNDLLWPLIVVTNERFSTPPLAVLAFTGESVGAGNYGPLMAAATFVTLPIIVLFVLGQRHMTDGFSFMGKEK